MSVRPRAAVLKAARHFEIQEFAPPLLAADDGLLRVEACGLCGTDYEQWQGHLNRWGRMPIIPGHEVIGRIEALGAQAARHWKVKEGDRVAIEPVVPCGHCPQCAVGAFTRCQADIGYGLYQGVEIAPSLWGGYASHMYLHPRTMIHRLPDRIPRNVMSLFNPLSNAVRWIYDVGRVGLGTRVLISGPGQRGLLAVAVARQAGASQIIVTGTRHDMARLALARRLGATATIDVDAQDGVERVRDLTGGELVDVVLEVSSGATEPVVQAIDMVRRGGRIVLAGLKGKRLDALPIDQIVFREIELLGVLSSGASSTRLAIDLISQIGESELAVLCTHSFPLGQADLAVRTLGREIEGSADAVHITLDVAAD